MCTYCGKEVETQQHVFRECTAPAITGIKQQLFADIAATLSEYLHKDVAAWLVDNVEEIWENPNIQFNTEHLEWTCTRSAGGNGESSTPV